LVPFWSMRNVPETLELSPLCEMLVTMVEVAVPPAPCPDE
jgi:hypothetical protein